MLDGGPQVIVPDWLNTLLWATVAVAAVWVVLSLVVYLRRRASNLTPVNAPDVKKSAAPDFLKVDHRARDAQIARGEAFDRDLGAREAAEAASSGSTTKQVTVLSRLAGIATLLFSIFSLLSTAVGVIFQVDRIGDALSQTDKLSLVIQQYPIPFAVCAFVIGYYVVMFFIQKQWKGAK